MPVDGGKDVVYVHFEEFDGIDLKRIKQCIQTKAGRLNMAELGGGLGVAVAVAGAFNTTMYVLVVYQNQYQYSNMIIIDKGNTSSLIHSTTFSTATVCTAVQFDRSVVD